MSWPAYFSFLGFATMLVLLPGPDFAVVTKNTLATGRRRGWWSADDAAGAPPGQALAGWRQGFLSNITNPKVLVFCLAVLPQFLGRHAPFDALLLFALSHAVLGLLY